MASVSTHVLDGAGGGPCVGVPVTLEALTSEPADVVVVGSGITDDGGRIGELGSNLAPGCYRIRWSLQGRDSLWREVAIVVALEEDRHYHLPLLASGASAVTYLGV